MAMWTHADYQEAATRLWGPAGTYATTEFERLNQELFASELPPLPIVIGLAPYGHCIGMTMPGRWLESPRISLPPEIFNGSARLDGGELLVTDVLIHEMVHAVLMLRSEDPAHNNDPWCELITKLSPAVLGREIVASPVRPRRVPNPERARNPKAPKTIVRRLPAEGSLAQIDLARWPHRSRPAGYYDDQNYLHVPTY
jgi:hypothetical protein